jgi:hypothetical protein
MALHARHAAWHWMHARCMLRTALLHGMLSVCNPRCACRPSRVDCAPQIRRRRRCAVEQRRSSVARRRRRVVRLEVVRVWDQARRECVLRHAPGVANWEWPSGSGQVGSAAWEWPSGIIQGAGAIGDLAMRERWAEPPHRQCARATRLHAAYPPARATYARRVAPQHRRKRGPVAYSPTSTDVAVANAPSTMNAQQSTRSAEKCAQSARDANLSHAPHGSTTYER